MIVRLTFRQSGRVGDLATSLLPERYAAGVADWWGRDRTVASKHRVDVSMPAIAWRQLDEVMFDYCFDVRGRKAKNVRTTDLNALKSIRRALNVRESHPALAGIGAIGMISELVPAWRFPSPDAGGRLYSPYPVPGMPFVVLAPETAHEGPSGRMTVWVEAVRSPHRPLLDESEHLRFI